MLWLLSPAAWPAEWCNGVDDDGDGRIDEGPVIVGADRDGDGHAAPEWLAPTCDGAGPADDCDDGDGSILPEPTNEACNGTDGNCDGVIDDATCPCTVVATDSKAWQVCTNAVTWSDAESACRRDGGYHLASLASNNSQHQAEDAIAPWYGGTEFWIGLNDRTTEGTFVWSDGSDPSYTHWRNGEPNNGGGTGTNEDCVEIEWSGLWDDQSCGDRQPYLCEASCASRQYWLDADGDGLGDAFSDPVERCTPPDAAWVQNHLDCDDTRAEQPEAGYVDGDGDGVGAGDALVACGAGLVERGDDCDDADPDRSPANAEVACNGRDDDCDPDTDDVADEDGDGVDSCDDCDDTDPSRYPGAPEDPFDGVDADCDGAPERLDSDHDGLPDDEESPGDTDGDGVPDVLDPDSDGDGALDGADPAVLDPGGVAGGPAPRSAPGFGLGCATSAGPVGPAVGGLALAVVAARRRRRAPPG